jgi:hypothetical protein
MSVIARLDRAIQSDHQFYLNNPMDHPVKPDDDLIAYKSSE